jgi:predicted DNA-binding transcriptional regulator YafY
VPRNAEVIRQWTILREIETARTAGVTIDDLAALCGVTTRTIRRDLQALEEAGFPLFDDRSSDDGRTRWQINGQAFKGLAAGLTLAELCALYFSRTLLQSLSGTPFRDELQRAFEKLGSALTPHMRQFLDQLPRVIITKAGAPSAANDAGDGDADRQEIVSRAVEATLYQRQATIVYHSRSSDRTKTYLVHPYRLAYADGGLYLLAYVPEYGEVRTFAIERVRGISLLEERFTPDAAYRDVAESAFPHSLGVHSGPPERVEIDFQPDIAAYVRTRQWHPSQQVSDLPGGGVRVTLDVSTDPSLHGWILSFGPVARVVSPDSLARDIARQIEAARAQYS